METEKISRKQQKKIPVIPMIILSIVIIAAAIFGILFWQYRRTARQYETVFFPNTFFNGVDASGRTVEEVTELIVTGTKNYSLTISGRDDITEVINADDIHLESVFDGSLERILSEQNPLDWRKEKDKVKDYEIETMISYDKELLAQKITEMKYFDETLVNKPVNASLSEYISGQGYHIVKENPGNEVNYETAFEVIDRAVNNLQPTVDLEAENCYTAPYITEENAQLEILRDNLNQYVQSEITYQFGDKSEKLTGDQISEWLSIVDETDVVLDQAAVAAYVKSLATKYNTAYQAKELKTSYGKTVRITAGNYGWRINQGEETKELLALLENGEKVSREPVYFQTAASHSGVDYGDTYVEINLSAQHLFFYKDGQLLVESDFVSGNSSRGYDTPPGAFPLTYKERNATLKGENYATPVSYWMPYDGNIGMHDASWRSEFGKNIYKTSGSHGCINLPPAVAKVIYENISAGMPVLSYYLEGTEYQPAPTAPEVPAEQPPETVPEETTAPEETTVPEETEVEVMPEPETTVAIEQPESVPAGPGEVLPESEAIGPGV